VIYLEMSRDEVHGGEGWGFSECLWAPTRKKGGAAQWPFWSSVGNARSGDTVIHLRGVTPNAHFVGYSLVAQDGVVTQARPPVPDEWSFADEFFRAELEGFTPFHEEINLTKLFQNRHSLLEAYFDRNRIKNRALRRHIFYVRQSSRLQCLNGAYLSELDEELMISLFGGTTAFGQGAPLAPQVSVETGVQLQIILGRVGQQRFSDKVKDLYANRCCFPGCEIADPRFLVGSHIARWSDSPELRGELGNGLCLCLIHDKAFELGLFTIDEDFKVFANPKRMAKDGIDFCELHSQHGNQIRLAHIRPMPEAVLEHWERSGIYPA
jgi:putative restriction endonuclease